MSNKTIKVDEVSKAEASSTEEAKGQAAAKAEESSKGKNPKKEEDKTETAPKAVKLPNITLGKRTIQFRQDVKRLQIDGEVHDASDLIKDKETMQRLLRGNSPFIETVKK